jgi:hypothetical protein
MALFISRWISENARGKTPRLNSLLTKLAKKYRAAFDFDMGFILQSVKLVAGLDLEHEVENGPPKKKRGRKNYLAYIFH